MASVSNYMFDGMTRGSNDNCAMSQQNVQDIKAADYMLTQFRPDCPMNNAMDLALNQPNVFVKGSHSVGINGCNVDDSSSLMFGDVKSFELHYYSSTIACGYLDLTNARVKWFLSIDQKFLPKQNNSSTKTFRLIKVDNEDINLDYDFNKLHTVSYSNILSGYGFGIEDSIKSLDLVNKLKEKKTSIKRDNFHPLMSKIEI